MSENIFSVVNIMASISAIVLTLNEENNIERCLRSLQFCDEIIVVDSGSTDRTVEIAKQLGARIIVHPFESCTEQRKYSITLTQKDWILFIDADEEVTPALGVRLLELAGEATVGTIDIPRKNNFMGQWIRYAGWYPDIQRRMFRNIPEQIRYQNGSVHSFTEVIGGLHSIPAQWEEEICICHYPYTTLQDYLHRFNQYSTLEAKDMQNTLRCRKRDVIFRSLGMFSQSYFANKGYKDGMPGFVIAVIQMIYSLMLMIKIIEQKRISELGTRSSKTGDNEIRVPRYEIRMGCP